MKTFPVTPTGDRVIVSFAVATMSAGGIALPQQSQERPTRGKVVAVGPGRLLNDGDRAEMPFSVGQTVLCQKYGGIKIEVDGQPDDSETYVMNEGDVLGIVRE